MYCAYLYLCIYVNVYIYIYVHMGQKCDPSSNHSNHFQILKNKNPAHVSLRTPIPCIVHTWCRGEGTSGTLGQLPVCAHVTYMCTCVYMYKI